MLHDSYQILGLSPGADAKTVRAAFVREAKSCHPDGENGDAERFRAVNEAYEVLRAADPQAEARRHQRRRAFFDKLSRRTRPQSQTMRLQVTLSDLCRGAMRRLTLADHTELEVQIPPGHDPAKKLRIARDSEAAIIIQLVERSDDNFHRSGRDLHGSLVLPLWQMRQGAQVQARTPSGTFKVDVPALSSPGQVLRLAAKGLPACRDWQAGDLLLTLQAERAEAFTRMVDHFARRFAGKPKRLAATRGPA